jgi:hypothetical protein
MQKLSSLVKFLCQIIDLTWMISVHIERYFFLHPHSYPLTVQCRLLYVYGKGMTCFSLSIFMKSLPEFHLIKMDEMGNSFF